MAKQDQNKGSKLQSFFFIIVVPFIFAITVVLIILTIRGVDVFDYAGKIGNKIPGISNVVTTADEADNTRKTQQLKSSLTSSKDKVAQLKQEIDGKQAEIDGLNQQVEKLESELDSAKESKKDKTSTIKEVAQSFQEMDEKSAAPIIEKMDKNLAIQVLEKVPSEQRGKILGEMNPDAAASITNSLLAGNSQ